MAFENPNSGENRVRLHRRKLLRGVLGASLAGAALPSTAGAESSREVTIRQGGEVVDTVVPFSHGVPVEEFYNYDGRYGGGAGSSANTPQGLEADGVSNVFLYEHEGQLSLVLIHDAPYSSSGGSVRMDFDGLPADGSWTVLDDVGHAPDEFHTDHAKWRWGRCCTDGGAYSWTDEGAVEFTVTPRSYDGSQTNPFEGMHTWRLLSGDGRSSELDPTKPVTIRYGGAAKTRPSDADLDSQEMYVGQRQVAVGERGARSMVVDGTETLFHEWFALESGSGEVVTSYDEAVTVTQPLQPVGESRQHEYESTLEVPIDGATVEVTREVHVELSRERATIDYDLRMADSGSMASLTLYAAADFDVAGPDGDVAAYHENGEFAYVEDASDDASLVAGIAGDADPDDHDLLSYPAYEAIEDAALDGTDDFPQSGDAGDPVAVLAFDLGLLASTDQQRRGTSTQLSRQVRLGTADSVEELWDVLDRRVHLSFREPRLAQAVEDTRLVDQEPPQETTLRTIDDPPLIEDKNTAPLFGLDVQNLEVLEDGVDEVDVTVTTLGETNTHPGRTIDEQYSSSIGTYSLGRFRDDPRDPGPLTGDVPSFEYQDGVTAVRVELGRGDPAVDGDSATFVRGEDYEVETTDPLRLGFVALEGPNDGSLIEDSMAKFEETYEQEVVDTVEMVEKMYPVPEVRAYRHDDVLDGRESDDGDENVLLDAIDAKDTLLEEAPIDESETLRGTGRIEEFDATLVFVPDGYSDYHDDEDDGWGGLHKHDPEAAALTELDAGADTAAHEFGHHFSGDLYEEPDLEYPHELAQRDDEGVDTSVEQRDGTEVDVEFSHARFPESDKDDRTPTDDPGLVCREVAVDDDVLASARSGTDPLMSYGGPRWIDSLQYNDMIDHDLEPHPRGAGHERGPLERFVDVVTVNGPIIFRADRIGSDEPAKIHGEGDVSVEVLDADESAISSHQVQDYTEVDSHGSVGDGVLHAASVRVPFPQEAVYLRATRDGETRTTNVLAGTLRNAVETLPDAAFVELPDDRRQALLNKVDAVAAKIDEGAYRGAARQLREDVRRCIEQWVADDWDGTAAAASKSELLDRIESRASDVETLIDAGRPGGDSTGNGGNGAGN